MNLLNLITLLAFAESIALMWYKGSTKNMLSAGDVTTKGDARFRIEGSGAKLIIFNVTAEDNGEYICRAGAEDSAATNVQVTHSIRVRRELFAFVII